MKVLLLLVPRLVFPSSSEGPEIGGFPGSTVRINIDVLIFQGLSVCNLSCIITWPNQLLSASDTERRGFETPRSRYMP